MGTEPRYYVYVLKVVMANMMKDKVHTAKVLDMVVVYIEGCR